MKIICFAYNKKLEGNFFQKIAPHLEAKSVIVYVNKQYKISFKALKALAKADLRPAISFKCDFEKAYQSKPAPKLIQRIQHLRIMLTAKYLFLKYYTILQKESYDYLMIWSGITFRQAIAKEAAQILNIQPVYIENGLLPNTIVMDKKGVNFTNSLPRDSAFYQNYTPEKKSLPTQLIPRAPKKEAKFSEKKVTLPEHYIFIPFQVDYDTQIIINSPWIKDMSMLFSLFESMQHCMKNNKLHFVFKEHPSSWIEYPNLHERAEKNPRLHIINTLPTQTLIENAAAVATINSTVGIESLLLQKKVIVLGKAFYAIESICKKAENKKEMCAILQTLEQWQYHPQIVEKFLSYLYYEYLIPGNFSGENPEQYAKINQILHNG